MQAFTLKDEYAGDDTFAASAVMPGNGETLVIHERLAEGDGVIVTDNPVEVAVLQMHHALQEVPVPVDHVVAVTQPSRDELNAQAVALGVRDPQRLSNKDAVIAAMKKATDVAATGAADADEEVAD